MERGCAKKIPKVLRLQVCTITMRLSVLSCVCSCMIVCSGAHVCIFVWRQKDNLCWHFLGINHFFWGRFSQWPINDQVGQQTPGTILALPLQPWSYKNTWHHASIFFTEIMGLKIKFSCLLCKYFIYWAISAPLSVLLYIIGLQVSQLSDSRKMKSICLPLHA